jgi:hypothetical protein
LIVTSTRARDEALSIRFWSLRSLALAAVIAAAGAAALAPRASALSFVAESENAAADFGAAPIAECPLGRKVLGGGVLSSGGFNSSETVGNRSSDGPDAGNEIDDAWQGFVESYLAVTVTTYAICRNGSVVTRHKSIDFVGPGERATRTVSCPRGYRVTGGGVASPEDIEVKATRPVNEGRAWEGSVLNVGIATDWGISAFCVDGAFAKHLVYEVTPGTAAAGEQDGNATDCPGHDGLVGGGTYVGPGESNLNTTAPLYNEAWRSYVDHLGVGPSLQYKTYAICFKQRAAGT